MGEIYRTRNYTYVIPMILFGGALPFLFYAWWKGYTEQGFNTTAVCGFLAIGIDLAALCLFLYLFFHNPFSEILKLEKTKPAMYRNVVSDMEKTTEVCKNVWQGEAFTFFVGRAHIKVVPRGSLTRLQLIKRYSRGIGTNYRLKFVSDFGKGEVIASVIGMDVQTAMEAAQRLAFESGITLELDL